MKPVGKCPSVPHVSIEPEFFPGVVDEQPVRQFCRQREIEEQCGIFYSPFTKIPVTCCRGIVIRILVSEADCLRKNIAIEYSDPEIGSEVEPFKDAWLKVVDVGAPVDRVYGLKQEEPNFPPFVENVNVEIDVSVEQCAGEWKMTRGVYPRCNDQVTFKRIILSLRLKAYQRYEYYNYLVATVGKRSVRG